MYFYSQKKEQSTQKVNSSKIIYFQGIMEFFDF